MNTIYLPELVKILNMSFFIYGVKSNGGSYIFLRRVSGISGREENMDLFPPFVMSIDMLVG